jgi:hypothetical protein
MNRRALAFVAWVLGVVGVSCNGTTGDTLLGFRAFASGVAGASERFPAGSFMIQLTAVRMHVGALYFDEAQPGTGFDGPVCLASGVYAAQVPGPVDVDLLSTEPQSFAVYGNGTADTALRRRPRFMEMPPIFSPSKTRGARGYRPMKPFLYSWTAP